MRGDRIGGLALALVLVSGLGDAAAVTTTPTPTFQHENTAENLKALFEKLRDAIDGGDQETAIALTRSVLPNEARLRKALRAGVDRKFLDDLAAVHAQLLHADRSQQAVAFSAGDPR